MVAVFGLVFVLGGQAVGTHLGVLVNIKRLGGKLCRYNPRRHGDDPIAQDHDYGGNKLSQWTGGGNVTIAHCGERDNAPINAFRDAGKATFVVFDHVHYGAKNDTKHHHTEHKYQYFVFTAVEGLDQGIGLADKAGEF